MTERTIHDGSTLDEVVVERGAHFENLGAGQYHLTMTRRDRSVVSINFTETKMSWSEEPARPPTRKRKLVEDDVRQIRRLYHEEFMTTAALAEDFGVSPELIRAILKGKAYAWVEGPKYDVPAVLPRRRSLNGNYKYRVTPKMVLEIRRLWDAGKTSLGEISRRFGVSRTQVANIAHRRSWAWVKEEEAK